LQVKDFDSERLQRHAEREAALGERSFLLGGETFSFRPEVTYLVLERIAAIGDTGGKGIIRDMEAAVLDMLEDGQEERFLQVVRNTENPVTLGDLNDLCGWLTEQQTVRPTQAPLLSTDGRDSTGTDSTESSSSPPAVASAA
jgi:hypothetical protein